MNEEDMLNGRLAERRIKEIEDLARGWGKLLARDELGASKALVGVALE